MDTGPVQPTGAEEAAPSSDGTSALYRTMFEQSPFSTQILAPDGTTLQVNKAWERLWGLTPDQVRGWNILTDPQLAEAGLLPFIQKGFVGEPTEIPPMKYRPAESLPEAGSVPYRWVRAFLYPVKDGSGAIRQLVLMHEDITARVQAEERLRDAQELLEQRVEERTRELSALLDVSRNVASTLEVQPLMGLILDQLRTVVDYTGAGISAQEGDEVRIIGYRGPGPEETALGSRIPVSAVKPLWDLMRRGEPVVIDDVQGESPAARIYRETATGAVEMGFGHVRSWMAVPMQVKDRVVGALFLEHSNPNAYTDRQAALALAIARQAAVAIENARLYEQAQELAAVEERQRLARELHDSVSQALFGINIGAQTARALLQVDPGRALDSIDYVRSMAQAGMAEMRALLFELRPESLETEGLMTALQKQADALKARHEIPVETDLCDEPAAPLRVKEALYRIAQEALHNAFKHAQPTRVRVALTCSDEAITLEVSDNGAGFETGQSFPGHLGLVSMRERVARLGGSLEIESAPGSGTCVRARIPV